MNPARVESGWHFPEQANPAGIFWDARIIRNVTSLAQPNQNLQIQTRLKNANETQNTMFSLFSPFFSFFSFSLLAETSWNKKRETKIGNKDKMQTHRNLSSNLKLIFHQYKYIIHKLSYLLHLRECKEIGWNGFPIV